MSEQTADQTVETVATGDETVPTTADNTEADATTESEAPGFDASTLDEFGTMAVARATGLVERLNIVSTELRAVSSDPAEIQKAIYESLVAGTVPENVTVDTKAFEQYQKAVEIVNKVTAYFDTLADEVAKKRAAENTDNEKVTALQAERDNLDKRIKEARKMIALEYPGAESLLPGVVSAGKSGGSGTGRGAGGKKMRGFTVTVDSKVATLPNSDGQQTSSFAAGAKTLGIPTADLQRAYFAAIDATPENYQEKIPTGPTTLTVKDSSGADHNVVIERNAE